MYYFNDAPDLNPKSGLAPRLNLVPHCTLEQLMEQVALRILKQCCVAGVLIIAQSNVRNTTPYMKKLFRYLSVPNFVWYST